MNITFEKDLTMQGCIAFSYACQLTLNANGLTIFLEMPIEGGCSGGAWTKIMGGPNKKKQKKLF
jgi:hypothetical protein